MMIETLRDLLTHTCFQAYECTVYDADISGECYAFDDVDDVTSDFADARLVDFTFYDGGLTVDCENVYKYILAHRKSDDERIRG